MIKPSKFMRAALADFILEARRRAGYVVWNARGVRVTPDCEISLDARLSPGTAFFRGARVFGRANVGALTYGTACVLDNARIGKLCSIAPGALIGLNEHPTDKSLLHPLSYDAPSFNAQLEPAVLGHDVWVGAHAVIRCGVTVGHGSVIAAGAVVTADVPEFTIVGGVPAKRLGSRTILSDLIRQIDVEDSLDGLRQIARSLIPTRPAATSSA